MTKCINIYVYEYSAYFLPITYTSVKNQILCKIDLKSKLGNGTFTIYVLLTAIELPATFLELLRLDWFYLYITLWKVFNRRNVQKCRIK